MQINSLYRFIFFGTAFRYLQDLVPHPDFHSNGGPLANMNFILDFLNENNMRVSANAAIELRNFRDILLNREGENRALSQDDCRELNTIMNALRPTILAESIEVTAIFPREKRYNFKHLTERPERIFGDATFQVLPEVAKHDFSEACLCIAVERPTAAAFHLMRGTEATLKHFYFSVVKRGRKDPAMWANMVTHLSERKALDEATKGMLDLFRRGFRNPVAHPEKIYSLDEAQDLLGTTCQLITLLVNRPGYTAP